ncbi:hypothetical protein HDU82_002514 [Entophlyctis luteolus]|nr:hypothetical protein HDU82_002514 [Entophlyctis luteolus]
MDIEVLKKQKQHALDHPKEFVSMLVAKKITFPRLQQILAIPEIDMDQYEERNNKCLETTSGSSYIGNHVVRMAESDSDESEEDVDPEAKNSEEYSELMRLKALAKIRELEKTGSIEKLESIHHETHKINHDFEKVVEPEDSSPSEQ